MSDIAPEVTPLDFAQSVVDLIADDQVETTPALEQDTAAEAPVEAVSSEPELVEDEHGNLRDAKTGKFVARAEEVEEEEPETEEGAPVDEAETALPEEWELDISDPRIESYLGKYGGDLNKALAAAVEAQSTLGRQGQEIGEYRKLEQQLSEMRSMLEAQANRPAPEAPINWAYAIEQDPEQAAFEAARRRDPHALAAACTVWGEEEPFKASAFMSNQFNEWRMETAMSELSAREELRAPAASSSEDQEVAKVLTKHPDLEQYLPQIGEVLQERALLQQTLNSGTPSQKAQALEDAYLIARSRSDGTDTSAAIKNVQTRVSEESKQARAKAAVVRASRGSAASATQPTRVESFLDAFEAKMKEKGLMASDEA